VVSILFGSLRSISNLPLLPQDWMNRCFGECSFRATYLICLIWSFGNCLLQSWSLLLLQVCWVGIGPKVLGVSILKINGKMVKNMVKPLFLQTPQNFHYLNRSWPPRVTRKLITPDGNQVQRLDGFPWESGVGSSFPNIVHGPALKVAGKLIGPAIFIYFHEF
jgi:hypothetical protein